MPQAEVRVLGQFPTMVGQVIREFRKGFNLDSEVVMGFLTQSWFKETA